MSRRFPTVERKMQRLLGDEYVALPCDEDINIMFITEVLHEVEDHYIPTGIPEPFHEDFQQGSFSWNAAQEAHTEKQWPMGPVASISKGKIWPLLFLFKKGFYLVTVVALEKKYKVETVRAMELPQITAAFAVLEDICDFIPASLTIADVAGIAELQYYIRSAIPFGSPVNTNYHLLRMVRQGFPNKEDETTQRSPAWKPYLYKGKAKLSLSIVETVNCTLYGKPEYEDECFISGNVYCCADLPGIPEICVPMSFQNNGGPPPEISVHNCAHVVGGIKATKEDSFKISCTPPTGPFVLCRYRRAASEIVPVRGFYQIKEMSPVEFRLLLQIQFHPLVGNTFWSCQVRLPFHHRGVIKSHDLKCTGGSFSLTDQGQSILWNLNVRRPRGSLEANLLGELIFDSPKPADSAENAPSMRMITSPVAGGSGGGGGSSGGHGAGRPFGDLAGGCHADRAGAAAKFAGAPQLGVGGTLMVNKGGDAIIIGSALTPSGGLMYATPSTIANSPHSSRSEAVEERQLQHQQQHHQQHGRQGGALASQAGDPVVGATSCGGGNFASGMLGESLDWVSGGAERGGAGGSSAGGRSAAESSGGESGAGGACRSRAATSSAGSAAAATASEDRPSVAAASPKEESQEKPSRGGGGSGAGAASAPSQQPSLGIVQDPFLHGVNCYAEVFLEVPDTTLSGIKIDPKAVTVYPTSRVYGAVTVQKEVLTGKYVIWNMAGEVRGHHSGLGFDDCIPVGAEDPDSDGLGGEPSLAAASSVAGSEVAQASPPVGNGSVPTEPRAAPFFAAVGIDFAAAEMRAATLPSPSGACGSGYPTRGDLR